MKIKCVIFGHEKREFKTIEGANIITMTDELGAEIVAINICKRCGKVYSNWE
jgi:hypothetical protein